MEKPSSQRTEGAVDVLLALISHEWEEIHHVESERAGITNLLLIAESGATALIAQRDFSVATLPLCGLLILLGLLGWLASAKYYERFKFAQNRLTQMYRALDGLCPAARVLDTLRTADLKHAAGDRGVRIFGKHLERVPLNLIWKLVHATSFLAGCVFVVIVLFRLPR